MQLLAVFDLDLATLRPRRTLMASADHRVIAAAVETLREIAEAEPEAPRPKRRRGRAQHLQLLPSSAE